MSLIITEKLLLPIRRDKQIINSGSTTLGGGGGSGGGIPIGMIYPDAGIALSTGTGWGVSIANNSTNWNTAYDDRLKWDGGSTGLVAATGRTSLGGTTVGQNIFTLSNPSAVTFPRINADNTVTTLSAGDMRTALGGTTVGQAFFTLANPGAITFIRVNADNSVSALSAADFKTALSIGGSMVYPPAGIPLSVAGTSWGTSYTTTGSGTVIALATGPTFTGGVISELPAGSSVIAIRLRSTGNSAEGNSVRLAFASKIALDGAERVNAAIDAITDDVTGSHHGELAFYTMINTALAERMRINNAGNVLIHNPASGVALTLGRYAGQPNLKSSDAYMIMDSNSGFAGLNYYAADNVYLAGGGGNVGIGMTLPTTPGTKLDVNGVITATGGNSTQWNTAYTHSQDNSQAHSDYLINNGDDSTSGALTATNFILAVSDRRLKTKIIPVIDTDSSVEYTQFELIEKPDEKRYGPIAQQVQLKHPELVTTNEKGTLGIMQVDLLMYEVACLKNKISELEKRLN